MSTGTTSIIIPTWEQLEYLQQCLESIDAFTPELHEVIIVDNGSTDGTVEWVKKQLPKHREYILIRNNKNIGAAAATNQGIGIAKGDYLCFLNNDVVVSKEWLKGLIDCVESAKDLGMVGPRTNFVSGPQIVTDTAAGYDTLMKYQVYAENFRKAYRGLYTPYWRIIPFCGLVRKEAMAKVGNFDEQFYPGNFGDDDLCLRLCLAGYRNMICGDVFVHHHGSVSMRKIDFTANLAECEKKFNAKWAKKPTISAVMIVRDEEKCIA